MIESIHISVIFHTLASYFRSLRDLVGFVFVIVVAVIVVEVGIGVSIGILGGYGLGGGVLFGYFVIIGIQVTNCGSLQLLFLSHIPLSQPDMGNSS